MNEENKEVTPVATKKSLPKKLFRILLFVVLGVVILNALIYLLLSIPAVQQKLVDFAIEKIKPIVKTEISVDKIQLSLFDHVNLQGVYVESQEGDTLLYAKELDARFHIWSLLRNELTINSIELNGAYVNVSQKTPDDPLNFQFLIDAFASDTTEETSSSSMKIAINDINITDSRIHYNVLSEPETPGLFNPYHISVSNFTSHLKLPSLDVADLQAEILSLSLKENSGLSVKNIEAIFRSKDTKFWSEKLKIELPYSELQADSLEYNLLNSKFLLKGNFLLVPSEMALFMAELNQLNDTIKAQTRISGKLPAIRLDTLLLTYGDKMALDGSAYVDDYEKYDKSKLGLNIGKFKITPEAISQFAHIGDSTFVMPEMLSVVDVIRLNALATGSLDDLKLQAEAWTNQGAVQLVSDISVKDTTFQNFDVTADLSTQNFNLTPFVGAETGLGRVSLHTNVDAVSRNGNISAQATGIVNQLQYDSLTFRNMRFKGSYDPSKITAWVDANLPLGKLNGQALITQTNNPEIKFDVNVDSLKVNYFYTNPSWQNPYLSLKLNGDLYGNSVDNIRGKAVIDSLHFWGDNFNYTPGEIVLESAITDSMRYVSLESSILNARIDGIYRFSTLPDEFSNFMHQYLPGFFAQNRYTRQNYNNFNVGVEIFNTKVLSQILDLPLTVIEPIKMKANVNTIDNRLTLDGDIPYVKFGDMDVRNNTFALSNSDESLSLKTVVNLHQQEGAITLNMDNEVKTDTIYTTLSFKNDSSNLDFNGELKAAANFRAVSGGNLHSYLRFTQTGIKVKDLELFFLPAKIENEGNRTTIENFGFLVGRGRMYSKYFAVDGAISDQKQDTLNVSFANARIGDILRAFDVNNINAVANGSIKITNILDKPELYTRDLRLMDIIIFGDTLGTFNINSQWSSSASAIDFDMSLVNPQNTTNSRISGLVYAAEDKLDINVDLDRFSLKWLQPFMADMLNRVDGSISSHININGSTAKPQADGWLGFNDIYMGVDFTNVTYHIADTINVHPDRVGFSNLVIEDNNRNKAIASADINYEDLTNPKFDLNLDLNNFMVLNTETRTDSLFYGKLFATGNVKIKGDMNDIQANMKIKNEKNSKITISIPETSEAVDYDGIVYINVPDQDSSQIMPSPDVPLPLDLTMALTVTKDIQIGVVMNSSTSLNMVMNGTGLIDFTYDMAADNMRTFGDYTLTGGTVKIRPQNIKTYDFKIVPGSKVRLIGDPMRSTFDITAYYRVNASLATLDPNLSGVKIPVNCVLGIKGNMDKMDLTYDIELPEASDDIKQRVNAAIVTDDQKTQNFANLLLFGSFYSSSGNSAVNAGGNVISSVASNLLSGGLDALFGSVLGNNWQIGTNIDTKDGSFEDADVSVNVSTRLLDDKLKLNTNIGYRKDQTQQTDNFVGDFEVEYQLSNTVKLRAYNVTNDTFYKQAPTTQGVGVVYTKEARTLKELFRFFGKKKDKDQEEK